VRPTPLSREYRVQVQHRESRRPKVLVLHPDLHSLTTGARPPHVFPDDWSLCLYLGQEFDSRYHEYATTIIPWISEWLFFFEHWLITGEWLGGGHEPGNKA